MNKIKLEVEFTYDDVGMYGTDKEAKEWFFDVVLSGKLELYDKVEIGDKIGEVKVMKVIEESTNKAFIPKDYFNKKYGNL